MRQGDQFGGVCPRIPRLIRQIGRGRNQARPMLQQRGPDRTTGTGKGGTAQQLDPPTMARTGAGHTGQPRCGAALLQPRLAHPRAIGAKWRYVVQADHQRRDPRHFSNQHRRQRGKPQVQMHQIGGHKGFGQFRPQGRSGRRTTAVRGSEPQGHRPAIADAQPFGLPSGGAGGVHL